jgi:hypothetical protein
MEDEVESPGTKLQEQILNSGAAPWVKYMDVFYTDSRRAAEGNT